MLCFCYAYHGIFLCYRLQLILLFSNVCNYSNHNDHNSDRNTTTSTALELAAIISTVIAACAVGWSSIFICPCIKTVLAAKVGGRDALSRLPCALSYAGANVRSRKSSGGRLLVACFDAFLIRCFSGSFARWPTDFLYYCLHSTWQRSC